MPDLIITAPLGGWASEIGTVPDPVFADQMMGDGVAIRPLDNVVRAPCDGEVSSLHMAGHAVSLRGPQGVEILIHVGLDTVALGGKGFKTLVEEGQAVSRGDALLSFELDAVGLAARSLMTPVVVTNSDAFQIVGKATGRMVKAGDELMRLEPIATEAKAVSAVMQTGKAWVTLRLPHGIHARPAARLAESVKGLDAEAHLSRGEKRASVRSVVGLLSLGAGFGSEVLIETSGPEAQIALSRLSELLGSDMGETATPKLIPLADIPVTPMEAGWIRGVVASPGLAVGSAVRLVQAEINVEVAGRGVDLERDALSAALASTREQIAGRSSGSGAVASVMRAHLGLVDDPELVKGAERHLSQGVSAGSAWRASVRDQIDILRSTGDVRLMERVADLADIERQVLLALTGEIDAAPNVDTGAILIAEDMTPSQFVTLAEAGLGGVCLERGGPTSHVSILCASMGIPALVAIGPEIRAIATGDQLLLDADRGALRSSPTTAQVDLFATQVMAQEARRRTARESAAETCHTRDGVRIEIFANLASVEEAERAAKLGAEGSGLVRSEFLFLGRDEAPGEDEQVVAYQGIADALSGRPIIVRLLDIGGDKPAAYIPIGHEENPALGLRGVRVTLKYSDLLETQVRALLRVKPAGQCRIMIPMIAGVDEVKRVRAVVDQARLSLGIKTNVEVGVMVETPAAAVTADLLAAEADFLSIGTNDLTQYVLAMDRGNPAVAAGVDALHPAVLRMIEQTCRLSQASGRWVGVCGGLASDPAAVPILLGLGVTELSAVPGFVPEAKMIVRQIDMEDARTLARKALQCASAGEVRELSRAFLAEART